MKKYLNAGQERTSNMRLLSPLAANVSFKQEFEGDFTSCQPIKPNLSPQAAGSLRLVLLPNSNDCLAQVDPQQWIKFGVTVSDVTRLTGAFDSQKIN